MKSEIKSKISFLINNEEKKVKNLSIIKELQQHQEISVSSEIIDGCDDDKVFEICLKSKDSEISLEFDLKDMRYFIDLMKLQLKSIEL